MNYKVIDLFCGVGGMSKAFMDAGFNIVAAIDDYENINLYQSVMGQITKTYDICNTEESEFPHADVITSRILPHQALSQYKVSKNRFDILYDMTKQIRPKLFLIETSQSLLFRNNRIHFQNILEMFSSIDYHLSYQILDEKNFSEFPVICKRLYIIGIRRDVEHESFLFPSAKYLEYDSKIDYNSFRQTNDDNWYEINSLIKYPSLAINKFYKKENHELIDTNNVYLGSMHRMIVSDYYGLRKFTHNELSIMRCLKLYNYNQLDRKRQVYNQIILASNVRVIYAIAQNIIEYLSIEHMPNIIYEIKSGKAKKSQNNKKEINVLPKYKITNIYIRELKGLQNLDINISKNLVAIMGVNGSGKSTILHALACMYAPYQHNEDYKFSFFFTPNPNSDWSKSKLQLTHIDENSGRTLNREYKKDIDRWMPRYNDRPKRDTYFFGIQTCIPEIEIERQTSYIDYSTNEDNNKYSQSIIKDAAHILNKNYEMLTLHKTKKKTLIGVHTNDDLTYSSLSMGAGEQRLIKILRAVYNANQYSLILIDEIDLLLHVTALKRLIIRLSEIAAKKHLQIFFTTHCIEMKQLAQYVDIRYLEEVPNKTLVYDSINYDMIYELNDVVAKPLEIYVEDLLAETIIKRIADDLEVLSKVRVKQYGAASNAFVLAGGYILKDEPKDNTLIVLDGDVYKTIDEKEKEMKKTLSGTEKDYHEKIDNALMMITELKLPDNCPPEKYIYDLLISSVQENKELVKMAKQLHAVSNSHQWLDELVERMGHDEEYILNKIVEIVANNPKWGDYIMPIRQWLQKKKELLNL